jgi:glutathione S-transferase
MKLYHSQYTRSGRARWILEELGLKYDIERLALGKGEGRTPAYLAINPNGFVPSLVDGDLTMYESSAILMHLADKHPDKKLAPPVGSSERAHYYRWMVYVPSTVDPVLANITFHTKLLPEDKRNASIAGAALSDFAKIAPILENAVAGKSYVVGNSFTAADIAVASAVGWIEFLGKLGDYPKLAAYAAPFKERPAYKIAYAD